MVLDQSTKPPDSNLHFRTAALCCKWHMYEDLTLLHAQAGLDLCSASPYAPEQAISPNSHLPFSDK